MTDELSPQKTVVRKMKRDEFVCIIRDDDMAELREAGGSSLAFTIATNFASVGVATFIAGAMANWLDWACVMGVMSFLCGVILGKFSYTQLNTVDRILNRIEARHQPSPESPNVPNALGPSNAGGEQ